MGIKNKPFEKFDEALTKGKTKEVKVTFLEVSFEKIKKGLKRIFG